MDGNKEGARDGLPGLVFIEVTNHCNLHCPACGCRRPDRKKGYMDALLYCKMMDEVAQKDADARICLGFGGEPLLARFKLYYFIRYARKKGIRNIYMKTNGSLLTEEMSEMLLDAGIDGIRISAAQIPNGAGRDAAYGNAEYLIRRREERKMRMPIVEVITEKLSGSAKACAQCLDLPGGGISCQQDLEACGCRHDVEACAVTWDGNVVACDAGMIDRETVYGNLNSSSFTEIWKNRDKASQQILG